MVKAHVVLPPMAWYVTLTVNGVMEAQVVLPPATNYVALIIKAQIVLPPMAWYVALTVIEKLMGTGWENGEPPRFGAHEDAASIKML